MVPGDPYYGSGLSQGPPPPPPSLVDPYHNYDAYQKYYGNRSRESEYPSQRFVFDLSFFSQSKICAVVFSSDYEAYPNYRHESYAVNNGSQGTRRHDLPVDLPPPQEGYPPSRRQHPSYSSGSSNLAQYYGLQPR